MVKEFEKLDVFNQGCYIQRLIEIVFKVGPLSVTFIFI